ncbi:MAG: CBS domain-containing protein [Bacteroidales bacterium]|nr:CBS domain-containing protein [Bacteroidales bacterium]
MLARELISDVVTALRTSDTGTKALTWMELFRIKHLPIVNHREFLGLISDADIYDLNNPDEPVGNHQLSLQKPFVNEDQHIYEVIELLSRLELTLVPVLNHEKQYLGVITQEDLTRKFAHLSAMQQPGGIIELEMNERDYSLTEISQIVESNNARILSLYVASSEDNTKLRVTLKINQTDLTSVIETFNRYNYMVVASHMNDEDLDEFYQERFDVFLKYLNT